MSLIKWRNSDLIPGFSNMVENFFRDDDFLPDFRFKKFTMPAVNVRETDAAFELEVAAPGLEKKDFQIEVKERMLIIHCEKEMKKEEVEKNYTRREFGFESFERTFWLPENVKDGDIRAEYKEGVLMISVPKKEVAKALPSRKIKIS